jgi:hypothetical protein
MTAGIKTALGIFAFALIPQLLGAQNDSVQKKPEDVYVPHTVCVTLKDGVPVLMVDGQQAVSDILLKNGTKVTVGGRLIRADGTEQVLKDKDCVNEGGQLIRANEPKPAKKERTRK